MSIGAVLMAPIFTIVIGEYLRLRSDRGKEEYETLKELIAFRHTKGSQEYLSALNKVILVFDNDKDIKRLVKEYWNGCVNLENSFVLNRRSVELIHAICKHMGRNVNEFEIDSFFIQVPIKLPPINTNQQNAPTSTAGSTHQDGSTTSLSNNSITAAAGSLLGNI